MIESDVVIVNHSLADGYACTRSNCCERPDANNCRSGVRSNAYFIRNIRLRIIGSIGCLRDSDNTLCLTACRCAMVELDGWHNRIADHYR